MCKLRLFCFQIFYICASLIPSKLKWLAIVFTENMHVVEYCNHAYYNIFKKALVCTMEQLAQKGR